MFRAPAVCGKIGKISEFKTNIMYDKTREL